MNMTDLKRLPSLPLLLPLLLLAACAQAPQRAPASPEVPTAWQGAAVLSTAPPTGAIADPLLRQLQQQALAANRDVAQAALRWQQAQRAAAVNDLRLQPSLAVNSGVSRALEIGPTTRSVGTSVVAGFELDLWDRLAQAQRAQLAQAEAARTDIAAARALLLTQVAERYWTAAAQQAQAPAVREQQALSREILELTTLRVREGKLLPVEVDKAGTLLLADQVRLIELSADAQLQRHQLALLLDQPLPGPDLAQAQAPKGEPPPWVLGSPAEVLAQRPDVQRARLSVDAALARLQAAEADRYPRLSFSAHLGTGGSEVSQWLSQPVAALAANLVVPLVDWRRLDLQRDTARTDLELAALALRDTLGKALVEVEAQLIERQRLQQQWASQQARQQDLVSAERVAEARFNAGSISRLDLLQARRARLGGEQEQAQLNLRRWLNHLAMYRALGVEVP